MAPRRPVGVGRRRGLGRTPEEALPDKWEAFVRINYAFPEGAETINRLVDKYATEHNVQNEPLEAR